MNTSTQTLTNEEIVSWQSLLRAHAQIVSTLDASLVQQHNLGMSDYEVLSSLHQSPDKCLRMTELANKVLLSPSGLTRRLDGLVRKQLVQRQPCPTDGRGLLAVITEKGDEVVQSMEPAYNQLVKELFVNKITEQSEQNTILLSEILSPIANTEKDNTQKHITQTTVGIPMNTASFNSPSANNTNSGSDVSIQSEATEATIDLTNNQNSNPTPAAPTYASSHGQSETQDNQ